MTVWESDRLDELSTYSTMSLLHWEKSQPTRISHIIMKESLHLSPPLTRHPSRASRNTHLDGRSAELHPALVTHDLAAVTAVVKVIVEAQARQHCRAVVRAANQVKLARLQMML